MYIIEEQFIQVMLKQEKDAIKSSIKTQTHNETGLNNNEIAARFHPT